MTLPPEIKSLVEKHPKAQSIVGPEAECQGAKFHSPRPLSVHSYLLPDKHVVHLCGTCRDNLMVYVHLWETTGGFDWPVQRSFGNQIRSLGTMIVTSSKRGPNK
jgi:hypothetical protein